LVDGQQTNEIKMDVKQSNTPSTSVYIGYTGIPHYYPTGTQFVTERIAYDRDGFLYAKYSFYIKAQKVYYYYPKELTFVSGYPAGSYIHYPASGLVVFNTTTNPYLTLSTTGVAP
jgi:hypothetical protein